MMNFSADTALKIRDNAISAPALGMASLYENLPRIVSDFRLQGLPFDTESIEKIVLGVMLKGTPSEKTALLQYVPFDASFSFPDVKSIFSGNISQWETGKKFVSAQIQRLASFMGCQTPGEILEVSEFLLENFGGLTPIDFVRFFELCRGGKYRKEFQHVSVRGINAEFLTDWLNDYCEERETVWLSLVRHVREKAESRNDVAALNDPTLRPDELIREQSIISNLEYRAQVRRTEYERGLVEIVNREIWYKYVDVESEVTTDSGKTRKVRHVARVICNDDDADRKEHDVFPYEKDKPGASYKRLLFFFDQFVTLGDDPKPMIDTLIASWRRDYQNAGIETIAFEDFARAESTKFVRTGKRLLQKISAPALIRSALAKKNGGQSFEYADESRKVCDHINAGWAQYLQSVLEFPDAIPLKKDEYMIHQALVWIRQNGYEQPFDFCSDILDFKD